MEFVAKKKTLKVTLDGQTHEMRCPTIGERQAFTEKLKDCKPDEAVQIYAEWFSDLGLPKDVLFGFDADDFFDFLEFVTNPKKKSQS